MAEKHLLIICGEPSGELHAAHLVKALKETNPSLKISAIGSELLKSFGAEIFYDIKGLSVMGFFDVLKKIPRFFALKKLILNKIDAERPDAVIFVDFSGFNLRLAKDINNRVKTIYYVSPQVWASRPGRVKTIKRYIKKMIVLFRFEKDFYRKHHIEAEYVGHPLLDIVKPTMSKKEMLNALKINDPVTILSLFPGSRKQEVRRVLPVMLKSAAIISESVKIKVIIAKAAQVEWHIYENLIKNSKIKASVIEGKPYDCMNIADFCIVCSGTATLETAIMQKPFVIVYKTSLLNYLLYRPLIKVPFIGIINIVAGKKIIPEFIQFGANAGKIAEYIIGLINKPADLKNTADCLLKIKLSLGENNASLRAAGIISKFLN